MFSCNFANNFKFTIADSMVENLPEYVRYNERLIRESKFEQYSSLKGNVYFSWSKSKG